MHPDLAAFASTYRHRFPDLVITTTADDEALRLEWQEAPTSPCYAVEMYYSSSGFAVFEYVSGFIDANDADLLDAAVTALSRERGLSTQANTPILAAPGTFAALVLERRMLTPPVRPQSPDRLT